MKNILALIVLTVFTLNALGQETQTRNVGSFSGIKVAEGIDVYLKKGDKESVRVEASGTSIQNIITEVSGSYLKVQRRSGVHNKITAKVYVTYVKLNKLSASSAGNIFSEDVIMADDLEISCSSAGNIEIKIEAGRVEVTVSSAGDVELQGKTKTLEADISSAGELDAYDLEAQKVDVETSSAGSAKVNVTATLIANASSAGSIRYRGNPGNSITNSSSGGSVKKSN